MALENLNREGTGAEEQRFPVFGFTRESVFLARAHIIFNVLTNFIVSGSCVFSALNMQPVNQVEKGSNPV